MPKKSLLIPINRRALVARVERTLASFCREMGGFGPRIVQLYR